jgi:hypothetical protein
VGPRGRWSRVIPGKTGRRGPGPCSDFRRSRGPTPFPPRPRTSGAAPSGPARAGTLVPGALSRSGAAGEDAGSGTVSVACCRGALGPARSLGLCRPAAGDTPWGPCDTRAAASSAWKAWLAARRRVPVTVGPLCRSWSLCPPAPCGEGRSCRTRRALSVSWDPAFKAPLPFDVPSLYSSGPCLPRIPYLIYHTVSKSHP